jgi:ATP-dependent RNA helicase DDX31/DBP7
MADDGMLLNFEIEDGIINTKTTFKGGRWRDRVKAQKGYLYRRAKLSGAELPVRKTLRRGIKDSGPTGANAVEREVKRQKINGDFVSATRTNDVRTKERIQKPKSIVREEKSKEVISSLFSYNPKPKSEPKTPFEQNDKDPVEPSNAPLKSELDTFTSLGVSEHIASHLLNKMGLKAPTAIQKTALPQLLKEDSDAFIQAETGSGKTLAYLLPIVQKIMELSHPSALQESMDNGQEALHRDSGLFAIILAPTRELSKQIATVLENLLRCAYWIVGGTVIGGERKKSEKARLRKGLNILVATPGRLVDHLHNTETLDVSNVRWLVLDEGDRLMELGFEKDIQKIVSLLNLRMKASAAKPNYFGLPNRRTTVLCSATMKVDVERLGEISLKNAIHIQLNTSDKSTDIFPGKDQDKRDFQAPAQLKQSYAIVPAKQRLVSLIAYLKRAFARKGASTKAIVFISCADSVDFHFDVLTQINDRELKATLPNTSPTENSNSTIADSITPTTHHKRDDGITHAPSHLLTTQVPLSSVVDQETTSVEVYRLHGSLPQPVRTSTLKHFANNASPCILLATDVASRGLDVPSVDLVLEFDPAFSREDHIHRIGRTARAGNEGRACIFLMPGTEEGYVDTVLSPERREGGVMGRMMADEILRRGFPSGSVTGSKSTTGKAGGVSTYEEEATHLQLSIERYLLSTSHDDKFNLAKRAFQSHVRAYATHVASERDCFDIRELHLGHLCKAFGLRERPGGLGSLTRRMENGKGGKNAKAVGNSRGSGDKRKRTQSTIGANTIHGEDRPRDRPGADEDAARKMREKVRQSKIMGTGADEFNLG